MKTTIGWVAVATALVSAPAGAAEAEAQWEFLSDEGGVRVFRKEVPGSDLVAFRGESVVDLHISQLLGLYFKVKRAPEWVDRMRVNEQLRRISSSETILYQHYELNWPISDRDYVLRRRTESDPEKKEVVVKFESTQDPKRPENGCCVRARAMGTYWRFTALEGNKTKTEVEVHTDPRGWLPTWLVNMIQKDWPRNTILSLVDRAAKGDVERDLETAGW